MKKENFSIDVKFLLSEHEPICIMVYFGQVHFGLIYTDAFVYH